jgi:hypothetical protein
MPPIFHYTDNDGLLGILSSGSLFASDYRYLNDASEGSMIRDEVLPILEAETSEIMPKLVENGFVKGFYEFHGASGHRLQAEGFYKSLVSTVENVSPLFVLSFCRHEETSPTFRHGLLSQWRAYAGSAGFAIEFDEAELDELAKIEAGTYAYAAMRSDDVRYANYRELFEPDAYKGVAGEFIRRIFEPRDVTEYTGRKDIEAVVGKFVNTAPFLKHQGFQEEREYRIVAACFRRRKIPGSIKKPAKEIKFRPRGGLIVPYIELFKSSGRSLPIRSIIVGPHPFQDKQADAVKMALESTPFSKAKVQLSAIPFRR